LILAPVRHAARLSTVGQHWPVKREGKLHRQITAVKW
jgi:hypothetical protein